MVPLFLHQRENGQVTVTDEKMTRFWLTLDQGVELVLNSIELMKGGEIFVPKIPSMKIIDLAQAIAPDCKVKIMGIRPGEKLHEVLISEEEAQHSYEYKGMYVVRPMSLFREPKNSIWTKGKKMKANSYASDNNSQWLNEAQMKKLIS